MFNKVYWDKARVPALVLLLASIVCALIREFFMESAPMPVIYTLASFIPSIVMVQLLAYLSGRTLVDPDKEGNSHIWTNYICWIFFDILAALTTMYVKIVISFG